ncbi:putative membrane protein [Pseudooceanicola batsensis HTCC2597]|uniref:diguanylate cyclase n=1 Tax=Pseudooceanicola batsensis (strain ATCC BAA-863 / DSM 15984 / KCTC 12145 / HTCC2597) TaxID=252305 RepID=A3TUA6_PSEBH|nr:GGDEF domain-containing protein [Pseudooceanicola batsensis]EAQ04102.1 putative membrane protein [Pseudooceanicola batsensis HTCC2597]
MDRSPEADGFLRGIRATLKALSGVAFLLDDRGRVIAGTVGCDPLGSGAGGFSRDVTDLIDDVLGTGQTRAQKLALPDGRSLCFTCSRVVDPATGALYVLAQESRRPSVPDRFFPAQPDLLPPMEEIERARAAERRMREEASHWRQLSMTDRMTGLLNAEGFRERGRAVLKKSAFATLVYADLNGFKSINDTLGHAAGDELLRDIAQSLAVATRLTDLIARMGGDEFAILLPDCGEGDRLRVEERLRRRMERRFPVDGGQGRPTRILAVDAAIGMVSCPEDGRDLDELLALADARMYDDKAARREGRRSG